MLGDAFDNVAQIGFWVEIIEFRRADQTIHGHGALATKANIQEFHDMLVAARDKVKKLFDEGKSEQDVLAAHPLADLAQKWASAQGLGTEPTFTRNVYNSFRNHN